MTIVQRLHYKHTNMQIFEEYKRAPAIGINPTCRRSYGRD